MIVSVTTLGAADGDAVGAAGRVVAYLDGRSPARGGGSPGQLPLPPADGTEAVVGYYADSVEGPGRWLGRGISGMRIAGEVDKEHLRHVLLGQHARTGVQLLAPSGSAARAEQAGRAGESAASHGKPDDVLSLGQAASLLGVSDRYLRRIAVSTESARSHGENPGDSRRPYLDASHDGDGSHWKVTRAEVQRFRSERKPPAAVVGYDMTFSAPKSVSILWATASTARRAEIVAAVHEAVAAGMAYLEDRAAFVRGHGRRQRAAGLVAASYLHATSRALDPQLHCHVVVANMAEHPDGVIRAIDGRPLFAHAKTAGYLAAAELRHQLSRRLGVAWEPAACGVADVAGVSEEAIREMSRRADDIAELTELLGVDSALARQMAAYATRAAKEQAVDAAALRPAWQDRLAATGFDARVAEACYDRQAAPALATAEDRGRLFQRLGSAQGVTELSSTFDRRDVLQHVAEWAGDRLTASEIADLADEWLANDLVVSVEEGPRLGRTADVIRLAAGRVVSAVGNERLCTTRQVLDVEASIAAAYERGRDAGTAVVPTEAIEAALSARPTLGTDQRALVRDICSSGHRIQCVLGPAGSGKTTALEAAVQAWAAAGYSPIGAAVQGTAAEILGSATGIPSRTVASLLVTLDLEASPIGPSTVLLVDEASTLGNRDLARLAAHVERRGAALRLVGDPAQHSAVAAGGAWRRLVQDHPEDTPALSELRRQAGPDMAEVRMALREYRQGKVAEALDRLRRDERVVEADSADELLDAVVADWYVDRQRRRANPTLSRSSMMADHHDERRELTRRARAMLLADGTLTGPEIDLHGLAFQVGDEVIARRTERSLRNHSGGRRDHVRNGERGRVVEVRTDPVPQRRALVVEFERRGRIEVPNSYLSQRLRPGVVGGLAHSYALTTNAAQGETYEAGRHLTTDRSSRPGVYIGLSRGRADARLYIVRKRQLEARTDEHPDMPRLEDATSTMAAVTARLRAQQAERLATEADPDAAEVARLRHDHTLAELEMLVESRPPSETALLRRALADERAVLAADGRLHADAILVARLGPRPSTQPLQAVWDNAVGEVAVYRHRWGATPVSDGGGAAWAIGPEPAGKAAAQHRVVYTGLNRAEAVALSQRPAAELLAERRRLAAALAGTGRIEAEAAFVAGVEQLAAKEAELSRRQTRVADLTGAPRRQHNAQGLELARRDLHVAEVAVAVADFERRLARDCVGALSRETEACTRVRERIAMLDAAIDVQAERALDPPGPHLVALLGERPAHPRLRAGWDDAGRLIERYRLRYLDLGSDRKGFVDAHDGDPLRVAVGPPPDDGRAAVSYGRIRDAVAEAHAVLLLARLASQSPVPAAPSSPDVASLARRPLWHLRPQLDAARHTAALREILERRAGAAAAELLRSKEALATLLEAAGAKPGHRRGSTPDSSSFTLAQAEDDVAVAEAHDRAATEALAAAPAVPPSQVEAIDEAVRLREVRVHERTLTKQPRWLLSDVVKRLKADPSLHARIDLGRLADAYGAVAVFAEQARRPFRAKDIDELLHTPPDEPELARVWEAARRQLSPEPVAATRTHAAEVEL